MVRDVLLQAELAAKHFSQIRLFIPTADKDETRYAGYVIEWPRSAKKELPSSAKLKKLGLKVDSYYERVDYYKYSHTEYEEMKSENNKLDYLRFEVLRNYFNIKRLENVSQEHISNLKISLGYRETNLPKDGLNTSNSDLISKLHMVEDIEWFFNISSIDPQFKLRMPCYFGPLLFIERGLFPDKQISTKHRPSYGSQKNKDKKSLSNLYVLSSEDSIRFRKIADYTYGSLMQLVNDKSLLVRCTKILQDFEREKVGL